jgi:ribosomal protein S18 acetylase RimI-like enzyme
MKRAIEAVDKDGLPAYLESSNPRNMSLYMRYGFETMGQIKIGNAPPLHPMLRIAR